ncbi:MAG: hypothetical protein CVU09_10975 [Bacteroidetes bacterium HGW-Bacteroidetes-4]|jgi:hypothetical protein|nr:MAG: hypothetical protein CVU09_10975 [Bacteroidetes bacterium HGW-Bacteroidetes-4]
MKNLQTLLLLALQFFWAATVWAQLNYDTVHVITAGSGMVLTKINETTQPWTIQVFEIDLNNPYLAFETVKATDKLVGLEKTSKMAIRKETAQRKVVGAINGDFYSGTGVPTNVQVVNGEMLRTPNGRITFGFADTKTPLFATPSFTGKLICKNQEHIINNVNASRNTDQLILYNSYEGTSTGTNEHGTEIYCIPISDWTVNDTVWCIASNKEENVGNMNLTKGNAVLSGHGTAAAFLSSAVNIDDTIGIILQLSNAPDHITQLIGGNPLLVSEGLNKTDANLPSHGYERHPRTAVGFSADSSKLYWITVDGRQASSIGMTMYELAEFMLGIGIYHGINLDGGGSTTLVVNHQLENSPSDASGERNVANAFLAISTAPQGDLNYIKIQPDPLHIKYGATQTISLTAYNQYNNVMEMDSAQITWHQSNNAGTLLNGSLFKANGTAKSGYLKAGYQNLSDSIAINIVPMDSLWIEPEGSVTDSIQPVAFTAKSKNTNRTVYQILPEVISWSVADESIGTITQKGVFTGLKNGTTEVIATVDGVIARREVTVQIIRGTVLLDPMETPESWNISSEFMDTVILKLTNESFTEGTGSTEVEYKFTYMGRIPAFILSKTIETAGMPDSAWVDMLFDGKEQRVSFRFTTQSFDNVFSYSPIKERTNWGIMGGEILQKETSEYPLRFEQVKIEFWKNPDWVMNQVYSGKIYLDNLRLSYPGHEPIMVSIKPENPLIEGLRIFPNPAKQTITLEFEAKENDILFLKIFDLQGRLVNNSKINVLPETAEFSHTIALQNLKPGMYFIHLNFENQSVVKSFVVQ